MSLAALAGSDFTFAMSDPPWRMATFSDKGKEKKSAELHYDTMSLDDIKAMPMASVMAKDAMLMLWATRPMFLQALEVMVAWGFSYVTQGVWVKQTKDRSGLAFGTGYVLRDAHEPFIIGKRGRPKTHSKSIRSVIMSPRREHSRKPEEAYAIAEALSGPDAKRLDMFSRQKREGWTAFGNETEKFNAADVAVGALSMGA